MSKTEKIIYANQLKRIDNAQSLKKISTIINSKTNHCRKTKLMPINMDYCQLQSDAFEVFLGIHINKGGGVST